MRISGLAGIVTAFVLSGAGIAAGEANPEANGNGPRRAFRNQQLRRRREHFRTQHAENKTFRGTLKGKTPAEMCGAIIPHRQTQYGENCSFREGQYGRLVDFVKSRMAAKGVSAERQAQVLARIASFHDRIVDFRDDQHDETIALLDELAANSGLTREEMRSALRERHEERREETQDFRQELRDERSSNRPERQGNRGERKGRRLGQRDREQKVERGGRGRR